LYRPIPTRKLAKFARWEQIVAAQVDTNPASAASPKKVLAATCGIHAVHDGFTDTLYLLLPLWQAEFQLSYGAVGILRALYSAVLAMLQVPAAGLAVRFGPVLLLGLGTAISGIGYILAGVSTGMALLVASLMLGGLGSSTQHPIGSDLVASAFPGSAARPALGTYNFAGDIGKVIFPACASLLLVYLSWRHTAIVVGAIGIAAALTLPLILPFAQPIRDPVDEKPKTEPKACRKGRAKGFPLLLAIGVTDSATRMGFMTFLPFVLAAKGASLTACGMALSLTFAGGAFGKLSCGFLAARFGVTPTVIVTKAASAILIMIVLALPPVGILVVLPLLGMMLNGTSSAIYGSVPDFASPEERARTFGIFYTATIGAGAIAPVFFGLLSDQVGLSPMMVGIAGTALVTLPLAIFLNLIARPHQRVAAS
jgi:MFS family permease